jgi:hypothetical protein
MFGAPVTIPSLPPDAPGGIRSDAKPSQSAANDRLLFAIPWPHNAPFTNRAVFASDRPIPAAIDGPYGVGGVADGLAQGRQSTESVSSECPGLQGPGCR